MNDEQIKHLYNSLGKGIRYDGRKLTDFRKVVTETDISKSAEGSARVKIGETEVIAGVKLIVDKPYPDTPEEGTLMVGAELLPLSSPEFESGPPGNQSIELARVVDRGVRESKMIDVKKLCIEKGEKVWMVAIDICTINDAGNLLDASALAAVLALQNTTFPEYDGTEIDYKKHTKKKLPIMKVPVTTTVFKLGDYFVVDPSTDEEKEADARLTVAFTKDGEICAMQKGGDTPLSIAEIEKMIDLSMEKCKELRKFVD